MSQQIKVFFKKHHFKRFSTASLIENILNDMNKGLKYNDSANSADNIESKACQPMIPVYGLIPSGDILDNQALCGRYKLPFCTCKFF